MNSFIFTTNMFGDNLVWNCSGRMIFLAFGIWQQQKLFAQSQTFPPPSCSELWYYSLSENTLASISCTASKDSSTVPMLSKVTLYSFARLALMLELSLPKIRLFFAFLLSDQCSTYRQRLLGHCTQLASVLCRGGFSHCRPPETDRLGRFLFV